MVNDMEIMCLLEKVLFTVDPPGGMVFINTTMKL